MRTLLLLALMTSCNTTSTPASTSALPHIAVTSEGGIAGRGVGGITIDDAKIAASDMRRTCGSTLSNDERAELQSLTSIVAHETTEPARPDQIRYTLSVGDVRASWYGEEPPADVAAMFKALWRIRARVLSGC